MCSKLSQLFFKRTLLTQHQNCKKKKKELKASQTNQSEASSLHMLSKARHFARWKPIPPPPTHARRLSPQPPRRPSSAATEPEAEADQDAGATAAAAASAEQIGSAARGVFDGMRRRAALSWNATVAAHARRGRVRDALGTAARMHRSAAGLDEATYASALGACARGRCLRMGWQVHCQVVKSGSDDFPVVGASLLDFYSSCLDLDAARTLFDTLHANNELLWSPLVVALVRFNLLSDALDLLQRMPPPRDVFAWTAIISGYARGANEYCCKSLELFVQLLAEDGVMPNEFTYDSVLRACVKMGALEFGRSIHGCLIQSGFESEQLITSALVDLYCRSGAVDDAVMVYNGLQMPSLITSNTLIAGFISMGRTEDAKLVFSQMTEHDSGSYNLMIKAYADEGRLEDCRRMFEMMPRRNMVTLNSMMSVLLQNGKLEEGRKLFEQIKDERNTVTWNSMISGYVQNDQSSEALKLFAVMCRLSIECSASTFPALLHACATIGTIEQGKMVHALLCKTPFESNGYVGTALVDMYSKCGCVSDARAAFSCIMSPNVASWTSLINGLAQNGHWMEAIVQFARMLKNNVKPNEITFLGLLMASARAGLVNKGMRFFHSMESYGVVPTVEHYTCAVDLLGRARRVREAEKFISKMPIPADGVVWGALLTACWYTMDLEMGEKVAEKLFYMDTKHISAYVAMSNIYAKLGKWEDVVKVRTRLRSINAKKEPGCSWIEVKDMVHVFLVEDRNHPEREEIYLMLEDLVSNISYSETDDETHGYYLEPASLDLLTSQKRLANQ
ncbi:pentatricopeptide repeat-containing protein At2g13600-like [Oryza glaberrima]|uniref:pentatricopeptide repeat-containing protein At2g13600-like n=1 Tax=Oryza glaberrima TaxID=4538 RepID=UPI00224C2A59|nr:pentatricopeptide repeat-containing protein At2g13600-like [Oryza glaberrima]